MPVIIQNPCRWGGFKQEIISVPLSSLFFQPRFNFLDRNPLEKLFSCHCFEQFIRMKKFKQPFSGYTVKRFLSTSRL